MVSQVKGVRQDKASLSLFHTAYCNYARRLGIFMYGEGDSRGELLPNGMIVLIFLLLLGEVMQINGIYQNYSDILKISSSLVVYSFIIQIVMSVVNRVVGIELVPFYAARDAAKKFYEQEQKNTEHWPMLMSALDNANRLLKVHFLVSFVFFHTPVVTSWIVSAWKQDYIMAFCFHMPFIDPNTLFGFLVNNIFLTLATTIVYLVLMLNDMQMVYLPLQTLAMVDVFSSKMKSFGRKLGEFNESKETEVEVIAGPSTSRLRYAAELIRRETRRKKQLEKIESELITLIKHYEDYNKFVGLCITFRWLVIFTQLSTNAVAIGIAFLYIKLVSIPIGIAMAVVLFFQVLIPCVLGTVVNTQSERLLQAVCDFPWYELSPKMRKVYLQFVQQCQNTTEYELPIFGELNMELFTDIMNTSYSYLTYLMNFM
jgi:hypothetical protein